MEITRQSEHFDWFKDNSESHEGLEGTQRTNQMRRNITCKFTWVALVFHVGRALATRKANTETLTTYSQRCAKVLFSKENT